MERCADAFFDTEHTTTSSSVKTVHKLVLNYFGIDLVRSVVHFSVSKIKLTTVITVNIFSLFLETNRPYTRLRKCMCGRVTCLGLKSTDKLSP